MKYVSLFSGVGGFDNVTTADVGPTIRADCHGANPMVVAMANIFGGNKRSDRPEGGFYVEDNPAVSKPLDSAGPTGQQGGTVIYHENKSSHVTGADHARSLRSEASHSYQMVAAPRVGRTHKGPYTDPVNDNVMSSPQGVRRLTPTECCRLQGFPDTWNDWISDTQRYRQMGNAVGVPVAEWIGRRLMEVDAS